MFDESKKIFHGPKNICGAAGNCAYHQRQRGFISDSIVFKENPFYHNHSFSLELDNCFKKFFILAPIVIIFRIIANFLRCCVKYDIFNFYYSVSLLPMGIDLPILRILGKKIIIVTTGSDVRLCKLARRKNDFYHFVEFSTNRIFFDMIKKIRIKWQNLWVDRFISIRSNYEYVSSVIGPNKVIEDIWMVNLLDLDERRPSYETHRPPVVVHAPSHPSIKGTEYVLRAIKALRERGVEFIYKEVRGCLNEEALKIYREEADIIVDQLFSGDFGTFAMEGMSFGKPVCAYIVDEVKNRYFPDCPIVNCTIHDLDRNLEDLILNPEKRVAIGKEGRAFVQRHCDSQKITDKLLDLYKDCYKRAG